MEESLNKARPKFERITRYSYLEHSDSGGPPVLRVASWFSVTLRLSNLTITKWTQVAKERWQDQEGEILKFEERNKFRNLFEPNYESTDEAKLEEALFNGQFIKPKQESWLSLSADFEINNDRFRFFDEGLESVNCGKFTIIEVSLHRSGEVRINSRYEDVNGKYKDVRTGNLWAYMEKDQLEWLIGEYNSTSDPKHLTVNLDILSFSRDSILLPDEYQTKPSEPISQFVITYITFEQKLLACSEPSPPTAAVRNMEPNSTKILNSTQSLSRSTTFAIWLIALALAVIALQGFAVGAIPPAATQSQPPESYSNWFDYYMNRP